MIEKIVLDRLSVLWVRSEKGWSTLCTETEKYTPEDQVIQSATPDTVPCADDQVLYER